MDNSSMGSTSSNDDYDYYSQYDGDLSPSSVDECSSPLHDSSPDGTNLANENLADDNNVLSSPRSDNGGLGSPTYEASPDEAWPSEHSTEEDASIPSSPRSAHEGFGSLNDASPDDDDASPEERSPSEHSHEEEASILSSPRSANENLGNHPYDISPEERSPSEHSHEDEASVPSSSRSGNEGFGSPQYDGSPEERSPPEHSSGMSERDDSEVYPTSSSSASNDSAVINLDVSDEEEASAHSSSISIAEGSISNASRRSAEDDNYRNRVEDMDYSPQSSNDESDASPYSERFGNMSPASRLSPGEGETTTNARRSSEMRVSDDSSDSASPPIRNSSENTSSFSRSFNGGNTVPQLNSSCSRFGEDTQSSPFITSSEERSHTSGYSADNNNVSQPETRKSEDHADEPASKVRSMSPEAEDASATCPICFEMWNNSGDHRLVALKCGHLFGSRCIRRWLEAQPTDRRFCPTCKSRANLKDVRHIYARKLVVADTDRLTQLQKKIDVLEAKSREP